MTLTIGQHLHHGRYQIKGYLGQGGMGTIYVATDKHFGDGLVAIKENLMAQGPFRKQFEREGNLLYRLKHVNLPSVTNYFVDEDTDSQYLVMEYIDGKNLKQVLQMQQGPLPETAVLEWIEKVMDAVEYMHNWFDTQTGESRPILHRDIKPANIIRRADNGEIVLVDFGLVKHGSQMSTRSGARGVTPGYSPLEQYEDGEGTTAQTDIYALGATLYHLLTGLRPPAATNIAGGTKELRPIRQLNPDVRPNTERVIERAMSLRAADRFESVDDMRKALHNSGILGRIPTSLLTTVRSSSTTLPRKMLVSTMARRVMLSTLLFSIIGLFGFALYPQISMLGTEALADPTVPAQLETPVDTSGTAIASSDIPTRKSTPTTATDTATNEPTRADSSLTAVEEATQKSATPTRQIISSTITLASDTASVSTPISVPSTLASPTATFIPPPTSIPPTNVPPTSVPPTSIPPTLVPPTSVPPTPVPPTPTFTPVPPTPTFTPVPPTPVPPTPTFTPPPPPPTPTFTPPPRIVVLPTAPTSGQSSSAGIARGNATTLRLLSPANRDSGTRREFCWEPTANFVLGAGEGYELIFWKDGEEPNTNGRGARGTQTAQCTTVESSAIRNVGLPLDADLNWAVRRVIVSPTYVPKELLSEARRFRFDGSGSSGPTDGGSTFCLDDECDKK